MILSTEELTETIRPLVYGVADQDGVTKAIVKFIQQDREANFMEFAASMDRTVEVARKALA